MNSGLVANSEVIDGREARAVVAGGILRPRTGVTANAAVDIGNLPQNEFDI